MVTRLGRGGRWLLAPFLSAGLFIWRLPQRMALAFWAYLGKLGLALRRMLSALIWRPLAKVGRSVMAFLRLKWAYYGLLGLAARRLLVLFIWRPMSWIGRPLVSFLRLKWAYYGLLGLAVRRLLVLLVWRPLLRLHRPYVWSKHHLFDPVVAFISASLIAFAGWLLTDLALAFIRKAGLSLVGGFRFLISYFRSLLHYPWAVVQARVLSILPWARDQRRASATLRLTPAQLRFHRLAVTVITAGTVLALGFLAGQGRRVSPAKATEYVVVDTVPATSTDVSLIGAPAGQVALAREQVVEIAVDSPERRDGPTFDRLAAVRASLTIQDQREVTTDEALDSGSADVLWPVPDPLGKGGSLAFTLRREGNVDIYVLTLGQENPVRVTADPAEDRDPAWSPDGKELAFASRRDGNWEVYVLNLADGALRRLTDDLAYDAAPAWSPDGKWILYESYQQENLDLYIVASDGVSPPIRLTENPAPDFSPVWSPDGRHIAFTSWRSGNKDIFLMSLDDVSDERALNVTSSPDRYEDHPAFEPGGRYLSYHDDSGGLDLVYTLPLDGYAPVGAAQAIGQGRHASWSPDGSSLAYVMEREDQSLIIASNVDSWAVAPMAFSHPDPINDLAWMAFLLPRNLDQLLGLATTEAEEPLYLEGTEPQQGDSPKYLLWKVDVDAPSPYLSDRVDQSFAALRQRVIEEAGWDFLGSLDNLYATLYERPAPGEPEQDWNKTGRAFDFYSRYPISINQRVEIVREDKGGQTYWRVYLRTAAQDGTQGEPIRQMPWDFRARYDSDPRYYDQGGKVRESLPAGYYVDFTELAAAYGWTRTPALDNWRTYFLGTRYWHFEKRDGLTWEEALAEIYSPGELATLFDN